MKVHIEEIDTHEMFELDGNQIADAICSNSVLPPDGNDRTLKDFGLEDIVLTQTNPNDQRTWFVGVIKRKE